MQEWRFIDLDAVELPFLHSVEQAIAKEKSQNTLLLWNVNKPYITLGYFQNVYRTVNFSACKESRIPIVRRMGGGGAGYLTPKVLAYSIVANENSESIPKDVEKSYEVICSGVTLGLKNLSLDATFSPVNDVLLNGKKFCGSSQHRSYGMVIQHGFMSIDLELKDLLKVIRVPKKKPVDNDVSSLEKRITCVNRELKSLGKRGVSLIQVKKALLLGFEKALKTSFHHGSLSDKELKIAKKFMKIFESETWNMKPRLFGRVNAHSVHETKKGRIEIDAYVAKGKIQEILITGDHLTHPAQAITDLEATLRGVEAKEQHVRNVVDKFYKGERITAPSARPDDFTSAIMKAIGSLCLDQGQQ